jgi:hypothetical protein
VGIAGAARRTWSVNWQNISKAVMQHASVITITAVAIFKSQDWRDTQSNTMRAASSFHPVSRAAESLG